MSENDLRPYIEVYLSRIANALEKRNEILLSDVEKIRNKLELGEKSVDIGRSSGSTPTDIKVGTESTDSSPLQEQRVYTYKYSNGNNKTCNKCHGLISFDDFSDSHRFPDHVDEKGHIIGDGSCPEWEGG